MRRVHKFAPERKHPPMSHPGAAEYVAVPCFNLKCRTVLLLPRPKGWIPPGPMYCSECSRPLSDAEYAAGQAVYRRAFGA